MEEENKDFMSIFGEGFELNMDDLELDKLEEEAEEQPQDENINDLIEEETPEKVDEEEDDNNGEGNDSNNESSPNQYSSFVEALKEQGIVPSLESSDNIKTVEDLFNVVKKEIEVQAENKLNEYLDNIDISKIAQSKQNQITLDSVTEESLKDNINLAKEIIYKDYLNQGLSEDRAKKLLKKTIDLGEDIVLEDAMESLESLKNFEKKQIEQEKLEYQNRIKQEREEQVKVDAEIKNKIYNSKELVKGITNTKAIQDNVYKTMTEIVGKNPETGMLENRLMQDRSKNPIDFDIKMYYIYTLTNGFTDFSKVEKTTASKAVSQFEKTLRSNKIEDNGVPAYLQDGESYGGLGAELVL